MAAIPTTLAIPTMAGRTDGCGTVEEAHVALSATVRTEATVPILVRVRARARLRRRLRLRVRVRSSRANHG
jgi:hypothetical protein